MASNERQLSLFKQGFKWSLPSLLAEKKSSAIQLYDRSFLFTIIALMGFGFVMVMSASMPEAQKLTNDPFHFMYRHVFYL